MEDQFMSLQGGTVVSLAQKVTDIINVCSSGKEVVRIEPDGKIFWLGREVETDDDFRAAMLELAKALTARG